MSTPHSSSISDAATAPSTWSLGPLLGFDTETTGVDPSGDRLVTAALVWRAAPRADGVRPQSVTTWLADPGVEIPEAAAAVHGPVQDQRVGDGPQLSAKARAHRGQPVASELGLHEC